MSAPPPLSWSYNLARLGQAGDEVRFEADMAQRAAIAAVCGLLELGRLAVRVDVKKTAPTRFLLDYRLEADLVQACVVTLAPVTGKVDLAFSRALRLADTHRPGRGAGKSTPQPAEIDLSASEDEPDEIESLNYDLAGPALEEFFLALDPYPRCPGVAFDPGAGPVDDKPNPFAVLKSLKSSP